MPGRPQHIAVIGRSQQIQVEHEDELADNRYMDDAGTSWPSPPLPTQDCPIYRIDTEGTNLTEISRIRVPQDWGPEYTYQQSHHQQQNPLEQLALVQAQYDRDIERLQLEQARIHQAQQEAVRKLKEQWQAERK